MCTSDIEALRKAHKTAFAYLLVSIICALVGAVYESFSHDVYSRYMVYAFAFPLIGGTLTFTMLGLCHPAWYPNAMIRTIYHSGISTLTIGSIVQGVLEIYGTTNRLVRFYWYVGTFLILCGLLLLFVPFVLRGNSTRE